MKRLIAGTIVVIALVPATAASAQIRNYVAYLDSAQQVPPNASTATGTGTLVLDESTGEVTWSVTTTGLTGNATAGHIHPGVFGVAGGIMVNLGAGTSSFSGSTILGPGDVARVKKNETYFNVHTNAHGGGEIRGQIVEQAALDARVGNAGTAAGPAQVVLRVGGSSGHPIYRTLRRIPGPTTIDLVRPLGAGTGTYAVYIFPGDSTADTVNAAILNDGSGGTETLGTAAMCLPTDNSVVPGSCPCPGPPFTQGFVAKPIFGAGTAAALCLHVAPADPRAPTSLAIDFPNPPGTTHAVYTVAGIIVDPNTMTVGPRRVSLTNAVTVVIQ